MFATVAAIVALGGQLGGGEIAPFVAYNVAAGALVNSSSRAPIALASVEGFWGSAPQQSSACWVEGVLPEAKLTDAASRNGPLFVQSRVTGASASFQGALQMRQIPRNPEKSFANFI